MLRRLFPQVAGGAAWARCMAVFQAGSTAHMSASDKISNKIDELAGKSKEAAGRATDDPDLEAEGKGQQAVSNLKQAGEKIKDAFK